MSDEVRTKTETTSDGLITRRFVGDVLMAERVEKNKLLIREEWWMKGRRCAVVEALPSARPPEQEKWEQYRGFNEDGVEVRGYTSPGLDGWPKGSWSVWKEGTLLGEAPMSRLGLYMKIGKADLGSFAPRVMAWSMMPTPDVLADIVALDWSQLHGWACNDPRDLPFWIRGLAFDDDEIFNLCCEQLGEDAACQQALSSAASPVLTAIMRLLPDLPQKRQEELLWVLIHCWDECSMHYFSAPAFGTEDSLFEQQLAAQPMIAKILHGAADTRLQSEGQRLLAEMQAARKQPKLKRILDSSHPPESRCQWILELHKHPELIREDYTPLLSDPDPLVGVVAAYFCITRFQSASTSPDSTSDVVQVLLNGVTAIDELAPRFAKLSFAGPGLEVYLTRALGFTYFDSPERGLAQEMLPVLVKGLATVPESGLETLMQELLGLTFGQCELPFPPQALEVLGVMAQIENLDLARGALGNFGLPMTSTELRALWERLVASGSPQSDLHAFMHGTSAE